MINPLAFPRFLVHTNGSLWLSDAFSSPLTWSRIDGSAYINHIVLVRKARNAEPPATLKTDPLVYQGGAGTFLAPTGDIVHYKEEFGIDFEAEVCVVTDDVPMGTRAPHAAPHVRLVMLCNDVALRNLLPPELEKGLGFFVSEVTPRFFRRCCLLFVSVCVLCLRCSLCMCSRPLHSRPLL